MHPGLPTRAGLALALATLASNPAANAAAGERWAGTIAIPGQGELEFTVELTEDPGSGGLAGTIDIPAQGARGLALAGVSRTGDTLAFEIPQVGAKFALVVAEDGRTAAGHLAQSGLTLECRARRLDADEPGAAPPERPQAPRPPFPYSQWEVRYRNPDDGTRLGGTLTVPPGEGPFPAAVLITGSGPQDRDESLFGHAPFAVIADHLTRAGIAVLRSDDRGVGASQGNVAMATAADFAGDVRGAVAFLRGLETIDSGAIGLVGHSEGGIVAPMVAAGDRRLAFIVLLAGPGVPGRAVLAEQLAAISRTAGASEEQVEGMVALQQDLLRQVLEGAPPDRLREAIAELIRAQAPGAPAEATRPMVEAQLAQLQTPWFRSFLALDPKDALTRVRCPVLALGGGLDTQVIPAQNLPEIRAALARNPDVTVKELPGLNHLFQHAETGAPAEYARIQETFAPEVLSLLTDWIRQRTAAGKG